MSETPSFPEVLDALMDFGYDPQEVEILLTLLRESAEAIVLATGTSAPVIMNMRAHDLLEAIMPERAQPVAGSLHERLNRHFLPGGWTFVHDRTQYCVIVALKIA